MRLDLPAKPDVVAGKSLPVDCRFSVTLLTHGLTIPKARHITIALRLVARTDFLRDSRRVNFLAGKADDGSAEFCPGSAAVAAEISRLRTSHERFKTSVMVWFWTSVLFTSWRSAVAEGFETRKLPLVVGDCGDMSGTTTPVSWKQERPPLCTPIARYFDASFT
jgi:hypothetical protein